MDIGIYLVEPPEHAFLDHDDAEAVDEALVLGRLPQRHRRA